MTGRPVSLFMIFPPEDLNHEFVAAADLLEDHLAKQFPGYQFEVVDLESLIPTKPFGKVRFGDGSDFSVIPLMGAAGDAENPGFVCDKPDDSLLTDIRDTCRTFDIADAKRLAA